MSDSRSVRRDLIKELLLDLGEDPDREGLVKTPDRVARAFEFLTRGYEQDPKTVIGDALFVEEYSEIFIWNVKYLVETMVDKQPGKGVAKLEAMAKAILQIISDKPRALEMGRAARQRVAEKFTLQHQVTAVQNLYDSILEIP